jgi:hypothetical protein
MMPAVPPPGDQVRTPIDVRLKRTWRYDSRRHHFVSESGETFTPAGLPKGSRLVYKTPGLAQMDEARLSPAERDLIRYMQVILPAGEPPAEYVSTVRQWPPIEEASLGPEVSLPGAG